MERSQYWLVVLVFLIFTGNVYASNRAQIYRSYVNNDMATWKETINRMDSAANQSTSQLFELVNLQYGYIAWCIGNKRFDEARFSLKSGFKNLILLESNNGDPSTINAYRAAFYGYEIGLAKYKAPYYGLKSIDASKQALKQNENNWMALIQRANIQYYMPVVFGGSKTEALADYVKALALMEEKDGVIENNWNYLNLLTVIAEAYTEMNDYQSAEYYYKKTLNVEPEFNWVKNELYPQFLELKEKHDE